MKCYSKDEYLYATPVYPQRGIMGPELEDFGDLFWECSDYTNRFTDIDYCNERDVLNRVEGKLANFLKRYYKSFSILIDRVEVHISYKTDISYYTDMRYDSFLMRVLFDGISVLHHSNGVVKCERIPDYKFTARFDPLALSEGYLFECVKDRPFQKFLQEVLVGVILKNQDKEQGETDQDWIDKIQHEIATFLPFMVEVPDYAIDPFDFLDEDYTVKAFQQLSQEFDDDLSVLDLI